jgi:CBS domain-containing protein
MRARDLMQPVITVGPDDSAAELLRAFEDPKVRAAAVVSADGRLVGLISEEDMLASCLPSYVLEDEALAKVLEEDLGSRLRRRLEGKRVSEVVNTQRRQHPPVKPEATLIEVATAMARSGDPAVLVAEGGRVLGVITVDVLLPALLGPPSE